ncbi:MAG: DUF1152 domain-containing protein [Solirubrobacteraceae bacterium]
MSASPFKDSTKLLVVGIGGGGDVVGAEAFAVVARELGHEVVVGGLTWERSVIDPLPGPRTLAELRDARVLNEAVALAGPGTTGPGDVRFAESRMAELTGADVVLVDPHPAPAVIGASLDAAARELGCDHIVLLDVGGDVLGHGHEANLASPLADAVLLAASASIELPVTLAVWGAGCDGELAPAEVAERVAEVWAAGGSLGTLGLTAQQCDALEAVVEAIPTEASAMALRCARGGTGRHPIRRGRRHVELTPLGGLFLLLDCAVAMASAARCAEAVRDAAGLREANAILTRMGISTELEYELGLVQP